MQESLPPLRALVVCRNPIFGLAITRSVGAMGGRVHILSNRRLTRARFSRYCERHACETAVDLGTASPVSAALINSYVRRHGIDIVIAGDMGATTALAELQERLFRPVFPLASGALLRQLHDKWRFSWLLAELGLPMPRTLRLEPGESVGDLDLRFPLIAKPPNSEGCEGVARYDTRAALTEMLARPGGRSRPWLLQDYVPGRDIDISVLADRGRIVAWTVQSEHSGGMMFANDQRLYRHAERIVAGTNFHGVAHFDMRNDERTDEVSVIECNPRFWGSLMLSTWSGVNFVELGCRMAFGLPLPAFTPAEGLCRHQGVAPRRMIRALLRGRTAPDGLTPALLAAWHGVHDDPLPELLGGRAEAFEDRVDAALEPVTARLHQPGT